MDKKIFSAPVEFKEEGKGEFTAVFSTMNVVDSDKDVVIPGAFQDGQEVSISYWAHRWQDLPVGKGVIHADEEKAWVDGRFFLDTSVGKDTYQTVKNLGDLQRWSYGFEVIDSESGTVEGSNVRLLKKLDVFEVSPVLLAASVGTGTVAMKNDEKDEQVGEVAESDKPSGVGPAVIRAEIEVMRIETLEGQNE